MSVPQITNCPSCFTIDEVTSAIDPETHEWVFTCRGTAHNEAPYVWAKTPAVAGPSKKYRDGYFADLGVYDVLLLCVKSDDPWLEYGVVEDRFRKADPELYRRLVKEFSHSRRHWKRGGPDLNPEHSQTTSMRLAHALRVLEDEGLIAHLEGPATGYWHYLPKVSRWAPLPAPPADDVLTWSTYATRVGLDPDEWVLP